MTVVGNSRIVEVNNSDSTIACNSDSLLISQAEQARDSGVDQSTTLKLEL